MGWWPPQQGPIVLPCKCPWFVHSECEQAMGEILPVALAVMYSFTHKVIHFFFFSVSISTVVKTSESLGCPLQYSEAWAPTWI